MRYSAIKYIIVFQQQILVDKTSDAFSLPQAESINSLLPHLIPIDKSNEHFVASINNLENVLPLPDKLEFLNLRQVLSHFDVALAKQLVYYQQLRDYYLTHKFCGKCGNPTIKREINKFVFCENCQNENYPHIAPCVIVLIRKEDKILMARGVNFPPNAWGLIAGFLEIGESLEEAIARETEEEIGIQIQNIRYWGSQSWPFPNNSLMVGFTAEYKSGEITPDKNEIEAAGFYSADELPGRPSTSFSIASQMIEDFCQKS